MKEITSKISPDPKEIYIIKDDKHVGHAVRQLLKYDQIGFDTETYNKLDRKRMAFNPYEGGSIRLAQFGTPDADVYVFDLMKLQDKRFLHWLFPNPFELVGQNLKFDLKFLMWEYGIYEYGSIFDTMLAGQVLSQGWVVGSEFVPTDLASLSERYLGIELSKKEQASDWWKPELRDEQYEYAAKDAMIVLPIADVEKQTLLQQQQVRVAEIEFDCIPALGFMENNGMHLVEDEWMRVCEIKRREIIGYQEKLWNSLGSQNTLFAGISSLNLNSQDQVMKALALKGIKVPLDKEGKHSMKKQNLDSIMHHEEVKLYSKYVTLAKSISSYGPSWIDQINPYTRRIHGQIRQVGAETGRMSMKDPNAMTVPAKEDGNLYRNCFTAREGWVYIDTDYSQCELRILAELCRDPALLKAFDNDWDLHTYTASLIYKCAMEIVTKLQRGVAKNLNFGIIYGIGVMKFSIQAGIPFDQAESIMDFYLRQAYPLMGQFLEDQGCNTLAFMYAKTLSGRVRRYAGDLTDKQFRSSVQRNGKNMPIQGSNADITKRALALIYKQIVKRHWVSDVKMVLVVHDESLLESKPQYAMEANEMQKEQMLIAEREFLKRVPSKVDSDITIQWCKEVKPEHVAPAMELIKQWQ